MRLVPGRNGGKIRHSEKGEKTPGAGRPPGSKSFKSLLKKALKQVVQDDEGKPVAIKELAAIDLVAMLISTEIDDNTKPRAFQIIRDTIGEAPATKTEVTGKGGGAIETKTLIIEIPQDGGGE